MRVGSRGARASTLLAYLCAYAIDYVSASDYAFPIEIKQWDTGRSPLAHMVDVTNGFGLKVLAEHNFLNENNIAFSPYGLMGILVALYEGVDGESSYQIQRGMQLPWNRNIMRIGFRDIHRTLKTYFVPEEGFLAGLALNNENVTFNDNYKKVLRFYGFDLDNDQIPTLKPDNSTDETTTTAPTSEASETTTTAAMTTENLPNREATSSTQAREETTPNPDAETISDSDLTTTTVSTSLAPSVVPESTISSVMPNTVAVTSMSAGTVAQTTATVPPAVPSLTTNAQSTSVTLPSTVQQQTSPPPTMDVVSTILSTNLPSSTMQMSSSAPILETTTITTVGNMQLTTDAPAPTESTVQTETTSSDQNMITEFTTSTDSETENMDMSSISTGYTDFPEDTTVSNELDFIVTTSSTTTDESNTSTQTTPSDLLELNSTLEMLDRKKKSAEYESTTQKTTETGSITVSISSTTVESKKETTKTTTEISETIMEAITKRHKKSIKYEKAVEDMIDKAGGQLFSKIHGTPNPYAILERKKKSIVDFIYTNPTYFDPSAKSYDIPLVPDPPNLDNTMFLANGLKNVQVSYMHYDTILDYAYLPHLEASALRLPLDSDRYYLLVVLPGRRGVDDMNRMLYRMARESDLSDVHSALRPRRVRAIVPSFHVRGHVTLTTDLQKLGIRHVFEPRQRDFSVMTSQPGVYVRSIEQAVSVAIRKYHPDDPKKNRYVSNWKPVTFQATYPFVYFVMDSSIHVALMAGKMVDPLNTRIL